MDIINYLDTYKMTARELTRTIILDILKTTGIAAAAEMGPNLYLAKVYRYRRYQHIDCQ